MKKKIFKKNFLYGLYGGIESSGFLGIITIFFIPIVFIIRVFKVVGIKNKEMK